MVGGQSGISTVHSGGLNYNDRAYANMDLMPWGGLVIAGNMNFQHFEGLGEEYNRSTLFLNAAIGYNF